MKCRSVAATHDVRMFIADKEGDKWAAGWASGLKTGASQGCLRRTIRRRCSPKKRVMAPKICTLANSPVWHLLVSSDYKWFYFINLYVLLRIQSQYNLKFFTLVDKMSISNFTFTSLVPSQMVKTNTILTHTFQNIYAYVCMYVKEEEHLVKTSATLTEPM